MKRILLVDDDAGIRELWAKLHDTMEETFRGQCEMDLAGSLEHAEQKMVSVEYDVVILDLTMPPLGQDETISWLFENIHKHPPIVVLTGSEDIFVRRKCMLAGAANFMTKSDAGQFPNLFFKMLYNEYLRRIYDTEKLPRA